MPVIAARRAGRTWCALSLGLGLLGCAPKQPSHFEALIRVESDPGQPVALAKLSRAGQPLLETDAEGTARLQLSGSPGELVAVHVACPQGYRSPEKALSIVLRPLLEKRMPEYRAQCPPLLRKLVVAVRAQHGANVPVRYLGREIARTDAAGACHAVLKLAAGESATLTLDTSAPEHAGLMPQNPELKVTVPERDELIVFDQTFAREVEKPTRRGPRKEQSGPTRI